MLLNALSPGKNPPADIHVVIEIPQGSGAVKYEVDKDSGALMVDRFLGTSMVYPANYGFVPGTLGDDGDPLDVLVHTHVPLIPGSVVRARPIAVLVMEDEKGMDEKILAVPVGKLAPWFDAIKSQEDFPAFICQQIEHFFEHYKDLEPGKWVKIKQWQGREAAEKLITAAIGKAQKKAA